MPEGFAPPPPTYRPLLVDSGMRAAANRTPGKIALAEGERSLTYARLVERIDRVSAAAWHDLGLRPGDRVALLAANCLEYIEIICGLAAIGVAAATPNPRLAPAEARAILDDCGARVAFADAAWAPVLRDLAAPGVERVIDIATDYDGWLAAARPTPPAVAVAEWQAFSIPYTSGTTGAPKGVVLPHRARVMTFYAMAVEYGCYGPDDRALATAPMCHGAGLAFAMAPVFFGGFCEILKGFDAEGLLRRLHESRATNVFFVPTHLHALFALPPATLARWRDHALRGIICNAAPLPEPTKARAVEYFGEGLLHETYGSTEAAIVSNLRPADLMRKQNCVGLPFPAMEVRVLDKDGRETAPDAVGELFSRGPTLFNGYWNRPADTAAGMRDGQWFSAGDLARRDDEGFLYIVDRKKDMVISGGINIYPREIEDVLTTHPAIADAAVVGVADAFWGEALKAFVVLRRGETVTAEAIEAHCRSRLSAYKVPRQIELVAALPRNAVGKVRKEALRSSTVAGRGG
jgi:acyl-CoA synthetase (AMP-forming)/AMP-acid ligase II